MNRLTPAVLVACAMFAGLPPASASAASGAQSRDVGSLRVAIGDQSDRESDRSANVTISGRAYIFNHMDTGISGATIKVREFPKLSATADGLGDYSLKVPDDANVTPYILSGEGDLTQRPRMGPPATVHYHWNEIDLQTFHTRGAALKNANLQTPADAEFAGLKALLGVPARPDGRPEGCAIVTTASDRDVRGVDFNTFWDRTPHGVPGATSLAHPFVDGPVYFNESVIPDRTKTSTSEDGGIVWPIVPTGTYRVITTSPTTRFASFLATCRPGRVINANPPWGAYELSPGERPLGASDVAAKVKAVAVSRTGKRSRQVKVTLNAGEAIRATLRLKAGGRTLGILTRQLKAGSTVVRIGAGAGAIKRGTLRTTLKDAAHVAFTTTRKVPRG